MRPWAYEAHEAHEAFQAHEANPAHQAHKAMSMLDCPDDIHRENGSFPGFKKNGLHRDRRTDGRTDGHKVVFGRARVDVFSR